MKMILWSSLAIAGSLILILAWAAFPWSLNESHQSQEVISIEPQGMIDEEEHPSVIKILTFNIGFLYGKGSEGPGYEHRDRDFYEKRLKEVSKEIHDWGADVVCLQESDFDSSRSHSLNQAQFIAKHAGYPYVAEAHSWKSNYIPFPYWPLKNNFGQMASGGAILSRFPLSNHQVTLLKKPKSQPWWYNLFYLHRYFQKVTLTVGEKEFKLINLHLEAFDKVDRKNQVDKLAQMVKDEDIDIVAGDFNMLPTSANKRSKFFNDDEYENDSSYERMVSSGLSEVIPNDIYSKDESSYFTFPSWSPDRRLDYIWFKPGLKMMKAEVLPSASSDHLPLRATFQIDSPRFNPYSL
jgi:endonuclease/exonuclease/phosphatase family metal-dependent hydrolase